MTMTSDGKFIIYFLDNDNLQLVKDVCESLNYIFITPEEYRTSKTETVEYIFVDKTMDDFGRLNHLYNTVTKNIQIVFITAACQATTEHYISFLPAGGRVIINPELLKLATGKSVLKKFLQKESSIYLTDFLNSSYFDSNIAINSQDNFSIGASKVVDVNKITLNDNFNWGKYTDIICVDSVSNGLDFLQIRNYLNAIYTYLAFLKKGNIALLPFEIEYCSMKDCCNDDGMYVQISCVVKNFVLEYISESLMGVSFEEFGSFFSRSLKDAHMYADLVNFEYFEKSGKISIGAFFVKQANNKIIKSPSLVINGVAPFSIKERAVDKLRANPRLAIDELKRDIGKDLMAMELPGTCVELMLAGSKKLIKKPILLRTLVQFIQRKRDLDELAMELEALSIDDVRRYLLDFPNQKLVEDLNRNDLFLILKCLWNDDLFKEILNLIEQIKKQKSQVTGNDFSNTLKKGLNLFGLGEDVIIVKDNSDGNIDIGNVDKTIVKGRFEDVSSEIIRVKGDGEQDLNELKNDLIKILGSKLSRKKSLKNDDKTGLSNDSSSDFSNSLDKVGFDSLDVVASGIIDQALSDAIEQELQDKIEGLFVSHNEKFDDLKLYDELERKNGQIDKMKLLIDRMKIQILSCRKVISSLSDSSRIMGTESSSLIQQVESLNTVIAKQELHIKKMKEDYESKIKMQDNRLLASDDQYQELLSKNIANNSQFDLNLANKLQSENKALHAMLEMSNKKIILMTEQMENFKNNQARTKNSELEIAKTQLQQIADKCSKIITENKELRAFQKRTEVEFESLKHKFENERNELIKKNEKIEKNNNVESKDEHLEKDRQAAEQNIEIRSLKDELKKSELKIKELSQKIKFLNAQVDIKNLQPNTNGQAQPQENVQKGLEHKIKQLELVNAKLESSQIKNNSDLGEKKKELQKLKSENTMLKNRVQELERKVGAA